MRKADLLALVHRAASSPHGIVVKSPTPEVLRRTLYNVLRAEGLSLQLTLFAAEGELWLIPKGDSSDTKSFLPPEIIL